MSLPPPAGSPRPLVVQAGGRALSAWVMATGRIAGPLAQAARGLGATFLDVFSAETIPFYRLVNAGNTIAHGALGMPAWVQLDCCTLPSAMVGFSARREDLEGDLWERLRERVGETFGSEAANGLAGYGGPVPVSEFCALPSLEAGTVVGMSLYSLLRGVGLAVRTKALGLLLHGAPSQVGLTQYGNAAVRTHCAFGPLRVVEARAAAHTRPDDTFVYRLRVPEAARLGDLVRDGLLPGGEKPADAVEVAVDTATTAAAVARLLEEHACIDIVWPGHVRRGGRTFVTVRVGT